MLTFPININLTHNALLHLSHSTWTNQGCLWNEFLEKRKKRRLFWLKLINFCVRKNKRVEEMKQLLARTRSELLVLGAQWVECLTLNWSVVSSNIIKG